MSLNSNSRQKRKPGKRSKDLRNSERLRGRKLRRRNRSNRRLKLRKFWPRRGSWLTFANWNCRLSRLLRKKKSALL